MYHVLHMIRRLWITFLAFTLKRYPYLQVQLIMFHSIFMIMYTVYVKPF